MSNQTISAPMSREDERLWSAIAHLSVLLNLVTGILGPVAAIVIYLVFKDRSKMVANQSMQSFVFQLIFWIGGGALTGVAWGITGVLMVIIVGFCLLPLAIIISVLPIFALVYGVIAAIQVYQGTDDFRYWLVGDLVSN